MDKVYLPSTSKDVYFLLCFIYDTLLVAFAVVLHVFLLFGGTKLCHHLTAAVVFTLNRPFYPASQFISTPSVRPDSLSKRDTDSVVTHCETEEDQTKSLRK